MENKKRQAGKGLFSPFAGGSWRPVVLILLLMVCRISPAQQQVIHLAGGNDRALTDLARERIEARFGDSVEIRPYNQETADDELVLTLDTGTLAEVRANSDDQPIVALFSTSSDIERIVRNRRNFSAIYSDPPLERQARLGRLIIPRARTVAILASREQAGSYEALIAAMKLMGLDARVFVVSSSDTLIRDLSRALAYGDFILGTPDNRIFNRNTVKPLLLTSYRRNRLVIGPSRPFVRAGAVASTYTPARDQINEGLELAAAWFDQGELPEPHYPEEFQVTVNQQVARSMNLPLPSEDELRESLISREDEQ